MVVNVIVYDTTLASFHLCRQLGIHQELSIKKVKQIGLLTRPR